MRITGLGNRSPKQREETVIYLSRKTIRELTQMGALVQSQQRYTFGQAEKASKRHDWDARDKLGVKSAELAQREQDIRDALQRK